MASHQNYVGQQTANTTKKWCSSLDCLNMFAEKSGWDWEIVFFSILGPDMN